MKLVALVWAPKPI